MASQTRGENQDDYLDEIDFERMFSDLEHSTKEFGQNRKVVSEAIEVTWNIFLLRILNGNPPDNPKAWLLRVCRHKAMELNRRARYEPQNLDKCKGVLEKKEIRAEKFEKFCTHEIEQLRERLIEAEPLFLPSLTPLQRRIYMEIMIGKSNRKIARELELDSSNLCRAIVSMGKKIRRICTPPPSGM